MGRTLVAGLGLISMLGALVVGAYLAVSSLSDDTVGGASSGDAAGSLVLGYPARPAYPSSGNYTTATGSQNINGTLGSVPTDFEIPGGGAAGVNVVTVNVQRQGSTGSLKAEILEDGQIVQSQETNTTSTSVSLTYSP